MIAEDNKLLRTRNKGYKRITPKERKSKKKNKEFFSYSDYKNDFWFSESKVPFDRHQEEPMPFSL